MEAIFEEMIRLQDAFLGELDSRRYPVLGFDAPQRSGILSIPHPDAAQLVRILAEKGVSVTQRGGFLRIAPHFYNTEEDMARAAALLNEV
jgi:selenocysteine lyase/cysteine desulfurase